MEEFIKPLGLSQTRVAKDTGIPLPRINQICLRKRAITADSDLRLSRYFGLSEGWWLRLQINHDLEVAKNLLGKRLKKEITPLPMKNGKLVPGKPLDQCGLLAKVGSQRFVQAGAGTHAQVDGALAIHGFRPRSHHRDGGLVRGKDHALGGGGIGGAQGFDHFRGAGGNTGAVNGAPGAEFVAVDGGQFVQKTDAAGGVDQRCAYRG